MCIKAPKIPEIKATAPAPERDENASLLAEARLRKRRSKGSKANIFSTALGDSGFGGSVVKGATKLGLSNA